MSVTKDALLNMGSLARFSWFWGKDFFVETPLGNFHYSDPDYGGDNTMTLFEGSYEKFRIYLNFQTSRDKGFHDIEEYCGKDFTLVIPQITIPRGVSSPFMEKE